jgi:Ca2+-transporting ATPase
MVTGDHPSTARAIAAEIGLGGGRPRVLAMGSDREDAVALAGQEDVDVVARATPLQKLALVRALQARGEIVAVTGDGVNDVPALQQADIGIAMGERGTRSAREVSPVVLMDDNFRTIVQAVGEGRQLFRNLRLSFAYLLLVHLPLVLGAALIPLSGLPLLYLPIHIVWLELVIHPTAMLAFQDLPGSDPLGRVDRNRRPRFFDGIAWARIAGGGLALTAVLVAGYRLALAGGAVEHARAMTLASLSVASACVAAGLTRLRSMAARLVAGATVVSAAVLIQWPPASRLLHLQPLHGADWTYVAGVGVLAWLVARAVARRIRST